MLKKIAFFVFTSALLLQSLPAFADHWDRHDNRRWERGFVVHRLPPGYRTIRVRGLSYLYCEGLFYQYSPSGYIIVDPPVGAIVSDLPPGYTRVVIQQTPYYYYGNTYYVSSPSGYVVAQEPPIAVAPATALPAPSATPAVSPSPVVKTEYKSEVNNYEIYIPNDNGSYTLITLKKTEQGFVGPQGEIYAEHPTVEILKARYIKK